VASSHYPSIARQCLTDTGTFSAAVAIGLTDMETRTHPVVEKMLTTCSLPYPVALMRTCLDHRFGDSVFRMFDRAGMADDEQLTQSSSLGEGLVDIPADMNSKGETVHRNYEITNETGCRMTLLHRKDLVARRNEVVEAAQAKVCLSKQATLDKQSRYSELGKVFFTKVISAMEESSSTGRKQRGEENRSWAGRCAKLEHCLGIQSKGNRTLLPELDGFIRSRMSADPTTPGYTVPNKGSVDNVKAGKKCLIQGAFLLLGKPDLMKPAVEAGISARIPHEGPRVFVPAPRATLVDHVREPLEINGFWR
jgi:hypothetical protein